LDRWGLVWYMKRGFC